MLDHLDTGAGTDPNHDPLVGSPLGLSSEEKYNLYLFLKSLRGAPTVVRGPTGRLCDDAALTKLRANLPR